MSPALPDGLHRRRLRVRRFNRVLSPQYIVWLVPLVPLVAGRAGVVASGLLLAAAGVTETWFPGRFWHLVAVSPVSWFALLRNLLLVGVFVAVRGQCVTTSSARSPRAPATAQNHNGERRNAPAASASRLLTRGTQAMAAINAGNAFLPAAA